MDAKRPPKDSNRGLHPTTPPPPPSRIQGENDENEAGTRRISDKKRRNEEVFELKGDIEEGGRERERTVMAGILVEQWVGGVTGRMAALAFSHIKEAANIPTISAQPPPVASPPRPLSKSQKSSVSLLSSALSHHLSSLLRVSFTQIRSIPPKPLSKIKAGLSLLHKRFQRLNVPYNTLKNEKLTQMLLNDFSLSVLSRASKHLNGKLKTEAFIRIKFTNQSRVMEVVVRKLMLISNSRLKNTLKARFNWWRKLIKEEIDAEIEKKTRISHGFSVITRHQTAFGPLKRGFQAWRLIAVLHRRFQLRKIKAGLVAHKLIALKRARIHLAWRKIIYFPQIRAETLSKTIQFASALSQLCRKNLFWTPFHRLKAVARLKKRREMALTRVLKLQSYQKAVQTSKFLGRLYHRLVTSAVESKRRQLRKKQSARVLFSALHGVIAYKQQTGFEEIRLFTSRSEQTPIEKHAFGLNPASKIQRVARMVRALYRFRACGSIAMQEALRRWRGGMNKGRKGKGWESALKVKKEAWEAVKTVQSEEQTSRWSPSETRPQTLTSQRSASKTRRLDSLELSDSLHLAKDLSEVQSQLRTRMQSLLESPSLVERPKRASILAKNRLKVYPMAHVLERLALKAGFERMREVGEGQWWLNISFSLTKRSNLAEYMLEKMVFGVEKMVKLQAFARIYDTTERRTASESTDMREQLIILEGLLRYRRQIRREEALQDCVMKWRQFTREKRLQTRKRVQMLINALRLPVRRYQIMGKSEGFGKIRSEAMEQALCMVTGIITMENAVKEYRRYALSTAVS